MRGWAGCSGRPWQLSDADHLQPQSPVSKTKGVGGMRQYSKNEFRTTSRRIWCLTFTLCNICISLITGEVKHVCVYLLAVWILSPVITGLRIVPHFLLNVYIGTDLEPFVLDTSPCWVTCVGNTLFHSVAYLFSLLVLRGAGTSDFNVVQFLHLFMVSAFPNSLTLKVY